MIRWVRRETLITLIRLITLKTLVRFVMFDRVCVTGGNFPGLRDVCLLMPHRP